MFQRLIRWIVRVFTKRSQNPIHENMLDLYSDPFTQSRENILKADREATLSGYVSDFDHGVIRVLLNAGDENERTLSSSGWKYNEKSTVYYWRNTLDQEIRFRLIEGEKSIKVEFIDPLNPNGEILCFAFYSEFSDEFRLKSKYSKAGTYFGRIQLS